MHPSLEDVIKISLAVLLGAAMGLEREYRSKAAGFRTLTMISVGACLFTIISTYLGGAGNPDRIASNVVQGIGFLGAGVIFKDNLSVSGLTTATAIWVSSAVGMAVGAGKFDIALYTTVVALVVLSGFELIQRQLDRWHQYRLYKVTFLFETITAESLEQDFVRHKIRYSMKKQCRNQEQVSLWYELYGNSTYFRRLDQCLLEDKRIVSFEN
jgi:putative Mg2+ transporter-C (MgtC) family protein